MRVDVPGERVNKMTKEICWRDEPDDHNFPAAENYLTLHFARETARGLVGRARYVPMEWFKARDILRASKLPLLGDDHTQVRKNLFRIRDGRALSPVVLVRSSAGLIVADGYHRVCAALHHDHDALVPAKIV